MGPYVVLVQLRYVINVHKIFSMTLTTDNNFNPSSLKLDGFKPVPFVYTFRALTSIEFVILSLKICPNSVDLKLHSLFKTIATYQ